MIYYVVGDDKFLIYKKVSDLVSGIMVYCSGDSVVDEINNPFFSYDTIVFESGKYLEIPDRNDVKIICIIYTSGKIKIKSGKMFEFYLPKHYKMKDDAVDHVQQLVKDAGKEIGRNLASIIVDVVGSDKWYLYHEVQKLCIHSYNEEISSNDLKETISRIGDYPFSGLYESLLKRDIKKFVLESNRIETTQKQDPSIKVTRFLLPNLIKVYISLLMKEKGMSIDQVSSELGINKWFFQKTFYTDKWKSKEVLNIISCISEAEECALSNSISPWLKLVSEITATFCPETRKK
jgi:DNA polymerase III delta subunit